MRGLGLRRRAEQRSARRPRTAVPRSWRRGTASTTWRAPGRSGAASVPGCRPAPGRRRTLAGWSGTRSRGLRASRSSAAATAGSRRLGPGRRRPSAERPVPGPTSSPAVWARRRGRTSRREPPASRWRRGAGWRRPRGRPGPGPADTGKAAAPEAVRAAAGSVAAGPRSSASGRSGWPPSVWDGSLCPRRRYDRCCDGGGTSHRRRKPEVPAAVRRSLRPGPRGAPSWCWPWWPARWCSSSCPGPACPAAHRRRAPC